MVYESEVRSDQEFDLPALATFTISHKDADEIRRLAKMVKSLDLYKVEKFDYRVKWHKTHRGGETERIDSATLNVSKTEFWFAAYIKHTDVEILTRRFPIEELPTKK